MSDTIVTRRASLARMTLVQLTAYGLLLAWVALLAAGLLVVRRDATLAQLEVDVTAGHATGLRATEGLAPRAHGSRVVRVEWRDGLVAHATEVLEVRRSRVPTPGPEVTGVVADQSVPERLAALDPTVRVAPLEQGTWLDLLGWTLPLWVGWAALLALGLTVGLVPLGPDPRYLTRWGWCWMVLFFGVFGAIGYLLLGVTSPTTPDEAPEGRASGWWFFRPGLRLPY